MKRREFLMVMVSLTVALVSAKGHPTLISKEASPDAPVSASEVNSRSDAQVSPTEMPAVESLPLISKDKSLALAYTNTLSILSTTNECSLFFGGSAASVEVFKQLIGKVEKEYLMTAIGIKMSGQTVNMNDRRTKTEYRLFDKVTINADAPSIEDTCQDQTIRCPRLGLSNQTQKRFEC